MLLSPFVTFQAYRPPCLRCSRLFLSSDSSGINLRALQMDARSLVWSVATLLLSFPALVGS